MVRVPDHGKLGSTSVGMTDAFGVEPLPQESASDSPDSFHGPRESVSTKYQSYPQQLDVTPSLPNICNVDNLTSVEAFETGESLERSGKIPEAAAYFEAARKAIEREEYDIGEKISAALPELKQQYENILDGTVSTSDEFGYEAGELHYAKAEYDNYRQLAEGDITEYMIAQADGNIPALNTAKRKLESDKEWLDRTERRIEKHYASAQRASGRLEYLENEERAAAFPLITSLVHKSGLPAISRDIRGNEAEIALIEAQIDDIEQSLKLKRIETISSDTLIGYNWSEQSDLWGEQRLLEERLAGLRYESTVLSERRLEAAREARNALSEILKSHFPDMGDGLDLASHHYGILGDIFESYGAYSEAEDAFLKASEAAKDKTLAEEYYFQARAWQQLGPEKLADKAGEISRLQRQIPLLRTLARQQEMLAQVEGILANEPVNCSTEGADILPECQKPAGSTAQVGALNILLLGVEYDSLVASHETDESKYRSIEKRLYTLIKKQDGSTGPVAAQLLYKDVQKVISRYTVPYGAVWQTRQTGNEALRRELEEWDENYEPKNVELAELALFEQWRYIAALETMFERMDRGRGNHTQLLDSLKWKIVYNGTRGGLARPLRALKEASMLFDRHPDSKVILGYLRNLKLSNPSLVTGGRPNLAVDFSGTKEGRRAAFLAQSAELLDSSNTDKAEDVGLAGAVTCGIGGFFLGGGWGAFLGGAACGGLGYGITDNVLALSSSHYAEALKTGDTPVSSDAAEKMNEMFLMTAGFEALGDGFWGGVAGPLSLIAGGLGAVALRAGAGGIARLTPAVAGGAGRLGTFALSEAVIYGSEGLPAALNAATDTIYGTGTAFFGSINSGASRVGGYLVRQAATHGGYGGYFKYMAPKVLTTAGIAAMVADYFMIDEWNKFGYDGKIDTYGLFAPITFLGGQNWGSRAIVGLGAAAVGADIFLFDSAWKTGTDYEIDSWGYLGAPLMLLGRIPQVGLDTQSWWEANIKSEGFLKYTQNYLKKYTLEQRIMAGSGALLVGADYLLLESWFTPGFDHELDSWGIIGGVGLMAVAANKLFSISKEGTLVAGGFRASTEYLMESYQFRPLAQPTFGGIVFGTLESRVVTFLDLWGMRGAEFLNTKGFWLGNQIVKVDGWIAEKFPWAKQHIFRAIQNRGERRVIGWTRIKRGDDATWSKSNEQPLPEYVVAPKYEQTIRVGGLKLRGAVLRGEVNAKSGEVIELEKAGWIKRGRGKTFELTDEGKQHLRTRGIRVADSEGGMFFRKVEDLRRIRFGDKGTQSIPVSRGIFRGHETRELHKVGRYRNYFDEVTVGGKAFKVWSGRFDKPFPTTLGCTFNALYILPAIGGVNSTIFAKLQNRDSEYHPKQRNFNWGVSIYLTHRFQWLLGRHTGKAESAGRGIGVPVNLIGNSIYPNKRDQLPGWEMYQQNMQAENYNGPHNAWQAVDFINIGPALARASNSIFGTDLEYNGAGAQDILERNLTSLVPLDAADVEGDSDEWIWWMYEPKAINKWRSNMRVVLDKASEEVRRGYNFETGVHLRFISNFLKAFEGDMRVELYGELSATRRRLMRIEAAFIKSVASGLSDGFDKIISDKFTRTVNVYHEIFKDTPLLRNDSDWENFYGQINLGKDGARDFPFRQLEQLQLYPVK